MSDIKEIIKELTEFRDAREWEQFHNPKDLALALNIDINLVEEESVSLNVLGKFIRVL